MHLSLQDGWTALIRASREGYMECVKVLLDKGAEITIQNKVSGVIIHCVHVMQHVPRIPRSDQKTCTEPIVSIQCTCTCHVV